MDIRKIKQIIDLMQKKGVNEIELSEGGESVKVRINTTECFLGSSDTSTKYSSLSKNTIPDQASIPASFTQPTTTPTLSITHSSNNTINSPMVGTLYLAPSPEAKPFVEVGQTVKPGDVLCIVEAMKMFNQIESDRSGTIKAILVKNGHPVEYDQPIFIIE